MANIIVGDEEIRVTLTVRIPSKLKKKIKSEHSLYSPNASRFVESAILYYFKHLEKNK